MISAHRTRAAYYHAGMTFINETLVAGDSRQPQLVHVIQWVSSLTAHSFGLDGGTSTKKVRLKKSDASIRKDRTLVADYRQVVEAVGDWERFYTPVSICYYGEHIA